MAWRRHVRAVTTKIVKTLVALLIAVVALVVLALLAIQTGWAKNQIRALMVRQANQYLTATLSIGRLEGSLLGGIQLGDVDVARGSQTLIHIDEIAVQYSIRELVQRGVVIRAVKLTRPRIVGSKQPDGKWDLGSLVKREAREQERTGPARPIEVQSIEIVDGRISLQDPLDFGPAHVPTDFESLNASFRFAYVPVRWSLVFDRVSWIGHAPDLSVKRLSGTFGRGPTGWFFETLSVDTPRSGFTLDGVIDTGQRPTVLDLRVAARRFAFQEWSGVLRGLKNIAVDAAFDTSLKGPVNALGTTIQLTGTGGSVKGQLTLDTSVPGWHGSGAVDLTQLNLARWLNRDDRPSDITGHVTFDLALELGRHFPRGVYAFEGRHAMYMGYAADNVRARGQITATAVLVSESTAVAYGSNVTLREGSIGIDDPFPFRFRGKAANVDLRRLPDAVPVPHVESTLALDYDVTGQFRDPFIAGDAVFGRSEFLGAVIAPGTTGLVDTSQEPVHFAGEGDIENLSIRRFGDGLDVEWMRDPRYAATVAGHFRVDVSGTKSETMRLTGGGRLTRAAVFNGVLSDADVSVEIDSGTLRATYDGAFATIDPAIPFDDRGFTASLTGSGRMTATVRDLLTRTTRLDDFDVQGSLALSSSTVQKLAVERGWLDASLRNGLLDVERLELAGAEIEGSGQGTIGLGDAGTVEFAYDLTRVNLAGVRDLTGLDLSGQLVTKGHLSGPLDALRAEGDANITDVEADDVRAQTVNGTYDVTIPSGDIALARGRFDARASALTLGDQTIEQVSGQVTLDARTVGFNVDVLAPQGRSGNLTGRVVLRPDNRSAEVQELAITLGASPWRLTPAPTPATIAWSSAGIDISPVVFVLEGATDERIGVSGTWRRDGSGALHVTAARVYLDTLAGAFKEPVRYGGLLDLDATIRGTRDDPRISARLTVSKGRIDRVNYDQIDGTVEYAKRNLTVNLRLDQQPGVWITAVGTVPLALFNRHEPEQPIDIQIQSSSIDLALLAGLTDVVRDMTGKLSVNVTATNTNRDPHFVGAVTVEGATFTVAATGARYANGRATINLRSDRVDVDAFHLEDTNRRTLDIRGSLGTHELQVGDVQIEANARGFEVLRSEFGRIDVDAALRLGGQWEAPHLTGDLTISSGELKVDEILQRTLFQPYATEPTAITPIDAVAALNPWERLAVDVTLHTRNTLRLTGENLQVTTGTPLGVGDINLRVRGDLYLFKSSTDSQQRLFINGSFDQVTGTYAFMGRRFDLQPNSSINFLGDLNPQVDVFVTRVISGVETRVGIFGPLNELSLHLSSAPPLDESDILSLIVFNTSTNQLSTAQQQELIVRAGALAAGIVATPLVSALENEIGLDILEIDPTGEFRGGPRLTIGEEIVPGLVARFSRQFGPEPYDEATVEYYLSRILRLRATFSDAQSLTARSPFRRVERAGVDLLLFFSF